MKNINLIFNFIGVAVVDWQPAFRFFSQTLGMKYQLEPGYGDWAMLGGGWDAYYKEGSWGAVFELFDGGQAVTERYWGWNQGIRPGFHVSNLQAVVDRLDIPFTVSKRPWGNTAEFSSTEGIRFAFAEIPGTPFSDDLYVPYSDMQPSNAQIQNQCNISMKMCSVLHELRLVKIMLCSRNPIIIP